MRVQIGRAPYEETHLKSLGAGIPAPAFRRNRAAATACFCIFAKVERPPLAAAAVLGALTAAGPT